jgi:peptidoglycan/xylan/chitin deacetylase (PgdA/CDA1 family)
MTILCYHSVDPEWESPLAVRPDTFAAHCAWLVRHRRVIPVADAADAISRSGRLPRGAAALTFDDGFAALADHAFPGLVRSRLPATVFLVAKTLTGSDYEVDWVDTPPAWPLRTLTREQVLEWREAGIRFASHSFHHHDLTTLSAAECVEDLRDSRELLEDLLREPVDTLAYPRGRHNAMVREAARDAGYRTALALPETAEPVGPHSIPRAGVYPWNGSMVLRAKTHPRYVALRQSPVFPGIKRVLGRTPRGSADDR